MYFDVFRGICMYKHERNAQYLHGKNELYRVQKGLK